MSEDFLDPMPDALDEAGSGARVRAFFAVALDDASQAACASLAERLAAAPDGEGVRWARPDGYHVTLRFLGSVAREPLAALSAQVGEALAGVAPFDVTLGAPHAFPSKRAPRVVAVPAEPEAPLAALAACIEERAVAAGHKPERRRFRAHLTLGRVRNRRFPALTEVPAPAAAPLAVRDVVLFQSELAGDGARYTALERLPLAAAAASGSEPGAPTGSITP